MDEGPVALPLVVGFFVSRIKRDGVLKEIAAVISAQRISEVGNYDLYCDLRYEIKLFGLYLC